MKVREAWVLQSMGLQRVRHDLVAKQQHLSKTGEVKIRS